LEFPFGKTIWGVLVIAAIIGVMVAVDVFVGAGNTRVKTGNGTNVVVGVIVGLGDGVGDFTGVLVLWVTDGEPVLAVSVLDD
jgi:hypothetical protein